MSSKDVALVLNYDRLGGAEKSALEQAKIIEDRVDVYYPKINETSEIPVATEFKMPKAFFRSSRSRRTNYFLSIFSYLNWYVFSEKIKFQQYKKIWLNGIKVFVLFSPYILMFNRKKKIYFHLRDYLPKHFVFQILFKIYNLLKVELHIIANSNSVARDFEQKFGQYNLKISECLNICNEMKLEPKVAKPKVISTASMLTPWKGIHKVILFEKMYRDELKSLGIEQIAVFGENIYKTDSGNDNYKVQLVNLAGKDSLVKFHGQVAPHKIFQTTDILIHSSIEPEPFGRVILEAFSCGIPVLSEGQGGASELFQDLPELIYLCSDFNSMFQIIKNLISNNEKRIELQSKLVTISHTMNEKAKNQLLTIFGEYND